MAEKPIGDMTAQELEILHQEVESKLAEVRAVHKAVAAEIQRRRLDDEILKMPDALRAHFAQRLQAVAAANQTKVGVPGTS